jgi:hypothetical protein
MNKLLWVGIDSDVECLWHLGEARNALRSFSAFYKAIAI